MTCGTTLFSITSGSGGSAVTVNVSTLACSDGVTIRRIRRQGSTDRFEAANGTIIETPIFALYRWEISGGGAAPAGLSALAHPAQWALTAPHPDTGVSTTVAVRSCDVQPSRSFPRSAYSFRLELDEVPT